MCCCTIVVFSWQAKQICSFGIARTKMVFAFSVSAKWQVVQGASMAECTDAPLVLSAWQEWQFAVAGG